MIDLKVLFNDRKSNFNRNRMIYLFFTLLIMCLELAFIFNKFTTKRITIISLIFSYGIEISQLYQGEWINNIRSTLIGSLVLGHGFLFSDLICYTIGIVIAIIIDKLTLMKKYSL